MAILERAALQLGAMLADRCTTDVMLMSSSVTFASNLYLNPVCNPQNSIIFPVDKENIIFFWYNRLLPSLNCLFLRLEVERFLTIHETHQNGRLCITHILQHWFSVR